MCRFIAVSNHVPVLQRIPWNKCGGRSLLLRPGGKLQGRGPDNLGANLIQGKNSVSQAVPVSGPSVHPCCGAKRQDQEQLEMSDSSSRERRSGSARRLAGSMAGECPRPPEMSSGNSPV